MAKVPILPMTVRGVERIKQKGQRCPFPEGDRSTTAIPFSVAISTSCRRTSALEACTWYAMRECFALYYRCAPERPGGHGGVVPRRHATTPRCSLSIPSRATRARSWPAPPAPLAPRKPPRPPRKRRRASRGSDSRETGRSLLRGAAGAGYGRRGHCRWRAGLHARAAHSQPAGGGRSGRSRRRGRRFRGGDPLGRCRSCGCACRRSRPDECKRAVGGHPLPRGDAAGAGRRGRPRVFRGRCHLPPCVPGPARRRGARGRGLPRHRGGREAAGHPEVEGLTAWAEEAGGKVDVVAAPEEIPEGLYDPVGVVAQTTQREELGGGGGRPARGGARARR